MLLHSPPMPTAWTQNLYHVVFGTRLRLPFIDAELEPRLHAFLAGIARDLGCQAIAVNGMEEHIHALKELDALASVTVETLEQAAQAVGYIFE